MRFMMMIPRVYQPDAPPAERAREEFAPPAEAVGWAKRCSAADGDVIRGSPGVRGLGLPRRRPESGGQPHGARTDREAEGRVTRQDGRKT